MTTSTLSPRSGLAIELTLMGSDPGHPKDEVAETHSDLLRLAMLAKSTCEEQAGTV